MPLYAAFSMYDKNLEKPLYRFEVDEYGIIHEPPKPPREWLMGHPLMIGGLAPGKSCLLSDVEMANNKSVFLELDAQGAPIVRPDTQHQELFGLGSKRLPSDVRRALDRALLQARFGNNDLAHAALEEAWRLSPEDMATARDALAAILAARTPKQLERLQRLRSLIRENQLAEAQALLDRTLNLSDEDRALVQRLIKTKPHGVRSRSSFPRRAGRLRPRRPSAEGA